MVKFRNVSKVLLLCGISLMSFSCSNTDYPSIMDDEDSPAVGAGLNINISTPSGDGVIYPRASEGTHEEAEWTIKTLNLYIFKKGNGDSDTDYTLADKKEDVKLAAGTAGKYTYTHPISGSLVNADVKIYLLANDKPAGLELSTTTLDAFKKSLATAVLTDNCTADVLVGGNGSAESKGFPMSGVGKVADKENIKLTMNGTSVSVEMIRTVARIDLINKTPNLSITGCYVSNAIDKSFLVGGQTTWTSPEGSKRIKINANNDWKTKFEQEGGVPYKPAKEGTADENNTLKHVLYLYEDNGKQAEEVIPTVEISYTLTMDDGKKKKNGTVSVPLKRSNTEELFPVRNNLYKIVLGDGKDVTDKVEVTKLIVSEWISGEKIDSELDPENDAIK